MPWALDGNNLAGGASRAPVRRAALDLARRERVRIVVFFDGAPPAGSPAVERLGGVEVRYVGHADSAILSLLAGAGRGWRVATDDRELAARATAVGAEVVNGAAFWSRVARAPTTGGRRGSLAPAEKPTGGGPEGDVECLPEAPTRVPRRRVSSRRHPR